MTITNQIKKFIGNIKSSARFIFLPFREESKPVVQEENSCCLSQENEFKYYAYIGTEKMREMLKSMEELKEANDDIFSLIKIIDDMAFQTNMLVLNSAAEEAGISNGIEMIFAPPKAYS